MFTDKVVLITGASSGFGAETALEFAKLNASLVLTGRNHENLLKISKQCEENSPANHQPHIVIADMNNETDVKNIIDETIKKFKKLDVLVNNAEESGTIKTTKSALDQFTRCVALELGSKGVRVNAVNPGVITTGLHKKGDGGMNEEQYEEFLKKCAATHALGRPGEVKEVASVIIFLGE